MSTLSRLLTVVSILIIVAVALLFEKAGEPPTETLAYTPRLDSVAATPPPATLAYTRPFFTLPPGSYAGIVRSMRYNGSINEHAEMVGWWYQYHDRRGFTHTLSVIQGPHSGLRPPDPRSIRVHVSRESEDVIRYSLIPGDTVFLSSPADTTFTEMIRLATAGMIKER